MYYDQSEFDVRCEWGEHAVRALGPISDVVIIVDVLSFSTCVDIAVGRGAVVYPIRWKDERAAEFAASIGAALASDRGGDFSLSPASMLTIKPGTKLVLPSQNGASLVLATGTKTTFCGSLRNCRAIADASMRAGRSILAVPAGERWDDDQTLRPAIEDLIGAGAIINFLSGSRSPEAEIALAAFERAKGDLHEILRQSASGKELIERGFPKDVELAAEFDVSGAAPTFRDGAFGA